MTRFSRGRRVRIVATLLVVIGLVTACGSDADDDLSDAFKDTASRSECVEVFQTYRDDLVDARITGNVREVVRTFYTEAVLACPTARVWHQVAEEIAPDTVNDWSSRYDRESVLRGMCAEIEDLEFDAPACS